MMAHTKCKRGQRAMKIGELTFTEEFINRNFPFLYLCYGWFSEKAKREEH